MVLMRPVTGFWLQLKDIMGSAGGIEQPPCVQTWLTIAVPGTQPSQIDHTPLLLTSQVRHDVVDPVGDSSTEYRYDVAFQ
jgi:hypothetical protein